MNEQIDYSRRDFLRRAIAAPVGVAAGIALVPTFIGLNLGTEAVTGMRAGNASEYEDDRERCAEVPEDQICPPPDLLSIKELYGDMGAPYGSCSVNSAFGLTLLRMQPLTRAPR